MISFSLLILKIKLLPFPEIIFSFSWNSQKIAVNPPKTALFSLYLAKVKVGPLSSHFLWNTDASNESSEAL